MANRALFASASALPSADVRNHAGALAYAGDPRLRLAQLALTGCLNQTYYANAQTQLCELLEACVRVDPAFVARTAVYARRRGHMKDAPAVLCAYLAAFAGEYLEAVFDRVIDNARMLRSFVQIVRSGAVARKSLGSRPKRLVQRWLERASNEQLIAGMVGQQPSLADVIKLAHPQPQSDEQAALFGYLIGRPVDVAKLPATLQALLRFRAGADEDLPDVPFQLLTSTPLSAAHWARIARQASWQTLRMNLATFARHGVYAETGMVRRIAQRLAAPAAIRKARVFPYQLLVASRMSVGLPMEIRAALARAMETACENVPALQGRVAIVVDVSGSMESPITGARTSASSVIRCVDVAALMAASLAKVNPGAQVLAFNDRVRPFAVRAKSGAEVMETTNVLTALLGGGTDVCAPLRVLAQQKAVPDVTIMFSDNQSWINDRAHGATETMRQFDEMRRRNPRAKLICVDLQPYANSQAREGGPVLNIGGFGDLVFELIAAFSAGELDAGRWVGEIERVGL